MGGGTCIYFTPLFNFLQSNDITSTSIQELQEKISAMNSEYYALRGESVSAERQIAKLNERLSMWERYSENKDIHRRLATLKPKAAGKY